MIVTQPTQTVIRLGDHVSIRTGKLDANASSSDGQYPFFTCASEPLRISSFSYDCECVLVAGNGDLNVKYYHGKFDAYQRTYIIESADKKVLDVRYLFHFMSVYVEQLRALSVGGVIKYIKLGNLTEAKIPLPPLTEQRRIAEVLDRAEALRAKRRATLTELDALTQSILADLLKGQTFETKPLEQIVLDMHQGINTVTEKIEYRNNGYPIIQSKHITQGFLDLSDARFVSQEIFVKYEAKYRPAKNDLLLCNIGTIGNTLLVEEEIDFLIAWNLFLIKLDETQVSPCYLKYFFDHLASRRFFDQFHTGGTVKFISKKTLAATPISVPPASLQHEFARRVAAVEKLKAAQRASLAELDALFASLQHRAFRGEL